MKKNLMLVGMLVLLASLAPSSGADAFLVYSGAPCTSWDPKDQQSGSSFLGYCGNRSTTGYQVQRDTYTYTGGHVPVVSLKLLLKCGVDSMPQRARDLYCP